MEWSWVSGFIDFCIFKSLNIKIDANIAAKKKIAWDFLINLLFFVLNLKITFAKVVDANCNVQPFVSDATSLCTRRTKCHEIHFRKKNHKIEFYHFCNLNVAPERQIKTKP